MEGQRLRACALCAEPRCSELGRVKASTLVTQIIGAVYLKQRYPALYCSPHILSSCVVNSLIGVAGCHLPNYNWGSPHGRGRFIFKLDGEKKPSSTPVSPGRARHRIYYASARVYLQLRSYHGYYQTRVGALGLAA